MTRDNRYDRLCGRLGFDDAAGAKALMNTGAVTTELVSSVCHRLGMPARVCYEGVRRVKFDFKTPTLSRASDPPELRAAICIAVTVARHLKIKPPRARPLQAVVRSLIDGREPTEDELTALAALGSAGAELVMRLVAV